jgi:hypothetical protein
MLHSFIRELACKTVFLGWQMSDAFYTVPWQKNPLTFDPSQYDITCKIEPYETNKFDVEINPIVIRNRDEILTRNEALARLDLLPDKPVCFLGTNGMKGEFEKMKKTYSYLEDEGYHMVYSTNYQGGLFPVVDYFNAFDLLICSAGYNAFWEARYFDKEAIFIPAPRRFEDQRKRVEECQDYTFEENGADQLVDMITRM